MSTQILSELSVSHSIRDMLSLTAIAPRFQLHMPESPSRQEVESYIRNKFRRSYNAQVDTFMPQLLTVSCNGSYSAAVGIRNAAGGPLYLENYLEERIESVLARRLGVDVRRERLVEIGNLVSTWRGSSQLLFLFLTLLLRRIGCEWVAFTATGEVERLLQKMQFKAHTLCEARREQVGGDAGKWGSYYETRPHVMAGYVPDACAVIRRHPLTSVLANALTSQVERVAAVPGAKP